MSNKPNLSQLHCVPCEGGVTPLTPQGFTPYLAEVPDWNLIEQEKKLQKQFTLKNFAAVMKLVNQIAELAQAEGHHPDLFIHDYKHLTITLWTHAIGGLSINDFVMAQRINYLLTESTLHRQN